MPSKTTKPTKAKQAKPAKATAKPRSGAKAAAGKNPLLAQWSTPFEMPPFDRVKARHFMPGFEQAFADNMAEIDAIAGDKAKPTFQNTIVALERAGRTLDRVAS